MSSYDHDEDDDYAELFAGSPAVGFLSKAELSAEAIHRLVAESSGTGSTAIIRRWR